MIRCAVWVIGVLAATGCGDKGECVDPKPSMQGCCAGHGGAEKCGEGRYRFKGERLVCEDGTLSDTCRR